MLNIDSWIRFALTEAFAVALLAFIFRKPLLEERKNVWLKILLVMLAMYLAHLFYALLSPTYFFRRFAFSTERVNLVPFLALKEWLAQPISFIGSVLLFMPIGFFEVLLHPNRSRKWQLLFSAVTAFVLALFVEFAQCFNYRVPDVDDVILFTLGGTMGALLCMLLQRIGFDRTRVGRVLLPRIPSSWRRHELLNRFCLILVVTMEVVLFAANYIVTIPKPQVRENTAAQTAMTLLAATAEPETSAVSTPEPERIAADVTAAPEPETLAVAVTPEPELTPRVYDTANLALEARNVLLVRLADDTESEQTIYAVGSENSIYPASTLKMLTALTVLDIAQPDETVEVGLEIYIPPMDAARAGLEYGMKLSVRDLLKGLLLPSGADAAYTLGVYCGRKLKGDDQMGMLEAVKAFITAMNQKAAEIGAAHTTAVNVVGLDDKKQQTTAEDILMIAKFFLDNPVLSEICSLPTAKITSENGKTVSLKNTNKMLLVGSGYYNEDVEGVKTGTTSKAGNCLVSAFTVEDERYLCIVMNSSYYGKFTDTQKLYELCANAQ
ncbi:MAG: VanZ family protein [Clostridia bacterium]|nr:VanZ family protein [Clostridia bacterium]